MIELFELTRVMFQDHGKWSKISRGDKKKHYFMVERFMAINYPLQAQLLSNTKIDNVGVLDFWFDFISKRFNKVPHWMFIKGSVKKKEEKKKRVAISNDIIEEYSKKHEVDKKSILDALKFFPERTTVELKAFEKLRNNQR